MAKTRRVARYSASLVHVLVLVEDGRRVHDELMVPHSLSSLFLNVFTACISHNHMLR